MENKVPSFKMCANPYFYLENISLGNLKVLTLPFTDVHGPRLHEGTSKYEDIFESLTVFVYDICTILCDGVQYRPNGSSCK